MKIITLNLARCDDLGRDYDARIRSVAESLDNVRADIVCFQEVSFSENESLADEINRLMRMPYVYSESKLSKKCRIADVPFEDRATSMRKMYTKDKEAIFTDGQAVLSNFPIKRSDVITLTKVEPDERGRIDRHTRIAQNIDFRNGLKVSNVHFASNNNAYQQLDELIRKTSNRLIIGDFNMTNELMQDHKSIWGDKFCESTEFLDYVSFPDDGVAYDHLLLPKSYKFVSINTIDNLSDHSAVIFEIEKK